MGYIEMGDFIYYGIDRKCGRLLHFVLIKFVLENVMEKFSVWKNKN